MTCCLFAGFSPARSSFRIRIVYGPSLGLVARVHFQEISRLETLLCAGEARNQSLCRGTCSEMTPLLAKRTLFGQHGS